MSSTAGYASEADALAVQYESITFEQAHQPTIHLFPAPASRVLDLGAGTGRDAAALAERGHHVTAVEPTAELRAHGERLHAQTRIRWIDDSLPELGVIAALRETFDLILLTAVWMHLDVREREVAMSRLAFLAARGGSIIMSLRHGPVPPGRRMFDVTAHETEALAHRHELTTRFRTDQPDMLGRADVSWTFLAFARA